jgi:hypothetical protein
LADTLNDVVRRLQTVLGVVIAVPALVVLANASVDGLTSTDVIGIGFVCAAGIAALLPGKHGPWVDSLAGVAIAMCLISILRELTGDGPTDWVPTLVAAVGGGILAATAVAHERTRRHQRQASGS